MFGYRCVLNKSPDKKKKVDIRKAWQIVIKFPPKNGI